QPHHDGFGLDAAYPPAQNTQAVDHGCVAVSTHTGIRVGQIGAVVISRPDHAPDVFKVQLVHDALARRHHPDAVEAAATPAQTGKALGVARIFARQVDFSRFRVGPAIALRGVVNNDVNGHLGTHLRRIAPGIVYGL